MDTEAGTTVNKLTIGGYVDMYYGNTFSNTNGNNVPYFVNMARNNELTLNLAYLDLRYSSKNFRARVVPGFGTYMNANYAAEPGTLRNIVEGSAGIKLSRTKEIWLDAGVLGSPYTNESAISKDHLMYTRSFAPEYVPYYLSGVKLSFLISKKVNAYLYLLNGWQQIQDNNSGKSIGTQIEFRPDDNNLINWNTYIGDERSITSPDFRTRYFTDLYWIYNKNKFSATACVYVGNQVKSGSPTVQSSNIWWQGNAIGRYSFTERFSVSARVEYFNDENNIQITPVNPVGAFKTFSGGVCLNIKVNENAMFRFEGRQFISNSKLYLDNNNNPSNNMTWLISNMTVWF
ncbi:MAG: porin [Saprospiraceae bacterium]|nr:porin [Saprospiraceae bacterium]